MVIPMKLIKFYYQFYDAKNIKKLHIFKYALLHVFIIVSFDNVAQFSVFKIQTIPTNMVEKREEIVECKILGHHIR